WVSRWICSRCCSQSPALPDGLHNGRKCWTTPNRRSPGPARSIGDTRSGNTFRWRTGHKPPEMDPVKVRLGAAPSAESCRFDTDRDALTGIVHDASSFSGGYAGGLARPANEAELVGILTTASARGTPILTIGSQSSLTGGAVPFGE